MNRLRHRALASLLEKINAPIDGSIQAAIRPQGDLEDMIESLRLMLAFTDAKIDTKIKELTKTFSSGNKTNEE